MLGIIAGITATTFGAFTEGVCTALACYTIAKGVGKANFSFKK